MPIHYTYPAYQAPHQVPRRPSGHLYEDHALHLNRVWAIAIQNIKNPVDRAAAYSAISEALEDWDPEFGEFGNQEAHEFAEQFAHEFQVKPHAWWVSVLQTPRTVVCSESERVYAWVKENQVLTPLQVGALVVGEHDGKLVGGVVTTVHPETAEYSVETKDLGSMSDKPKIVRVSAETVN